ncbi:hypothetical protein AB0E08_41220 [Streptomyces sp. NPDC048281]|uniref:restriction system modified-DNA reader domain-containing protein n=1 Tax=Streptomyces sp. NPDC048281 TaxID=3154715 RepID=UPI00343F8031
MTRTIRVDDEVFAKLQGLAEPLVDTPNSTLRRLLGLDEPASGTSGGGSSALSPMLADGRLSVGQRLVWRRRNLGQVHQVTVTADGGLRLEDGVVHATPSAAATALAGNQQNGWKVFATESGTPLGDLR